MVGMVAQPVSCGAGIRVGSPAVDEPIVLYTLNTDARTPT